MNDWTELIELWRIELEKLALLRLGLRVTKFEEGVEDVKERVTELLTLGTLLLIRLGRLLDDRSDEVVDRERLATNELWRVELEELALLRLGLRVTNFDAGVEDVKERVTELLTLGTLLVRLGRLLDDRRDEVVNTERLATDELWRAEELALLRLGLRVTKFEEGLEDVKKRVTEPLALGTLLDDRSDEVVNRERLATDELWRVEELALLRLGLRVTKFEEGLEDVKKRVTEPLALGTLLVRLGRLLDDRRDEVVTTERLATGNFELEDTNEDGIEEDEEELD